MCTTNYHLMTDSERLAFTREHLMSPVGRAEIANSFQAGILTVLPWSCAFRLFTYTDEIEEPGLRHESGSNPLIDIQQLREQRYNLVTRAFDLMRVQLTADLDEWAFETVDGVAQDLGTEVDDPAEWNLLDKAIDLCEAEEGWIFMNARTYVPYRSQSRTVERDADIPICGGEGCYGDGPIVTPDGRWKNGQRFLEIEHRRDMLRTGIQGTYRGYTLVVSRLVPVGSVYVTGSAGEINGILTVLSADEPPCAERQRIGRIGWCGTLKAQAKLTGPVYRYQHPRLNR